MERREFLKTVGLGLAATALPLGAVGPLLKEKKPMNVLFISIDDLNCWIGCLGVHPGVMTPNLDRLAKQSVLFSKAYCAAPACNPSRAALMTGIRPSSSGVYHNANPWRKSKALENAVTIPQYFMKSGYKAMSSGKIFHGGMEDPASWDYCWPSKEKVRPGDPMPENRPLNGIPKTNQFDWGPVNATKQEMSDWKVADWIISEINKDHEKPFFLGCGFFRPHLPWYVPKEYFDMYPLDKVVLPTINDNDWDDIPEAGRKIAQGTDHAKVLKYDQYKKAVQGYLACITFVDECVGRVLDAFEKSKYKDNTAIVLWSDHGWHLGEKLHWRKFALWEEATRNVLMISAPGISKNGVDCKATVNLMDLYPTLIDVCGLQKRKDLEGVSLLPLLKNPKTKWNRPSVTTHGFKNHSVRSDKWRYIRYADGSEELYDHDNDKLEWTNLATNPKYQSVKDDLKKWLPKIDAEQIETIKENAEF